MASRWLIVYHDTATFSDSDGDPWDAPGWGVTVIAQTNGTNILKGGEGYYWWDHDQWFSGDLMGLFQYLAEPGDGKAVVFGKWIDRDQYYERQDQAKQWLNTTTTQIAATATTTKKAGS